jgi:hypothetical protein
VSRVANENKVKMIDAMIIDYQMEGISQVKETREVATYVQTD